MLQRLPKSPGKIVSTNTLDLRISPEPEKFALDSVFQNLSISAYKWSWAYIACSPLHHSRIPWCSSTVPGAPRLVDGWLNSLRHNGRYIVKIGLLSTFEMSRAHSMRCRWNKILPAYHRQPFFPQCWVFWNDIELESFVSLRIVVAERNTTCNSTPALLSTVVFLARWSFSVQSIFLLNLCWVLVALRKAVYCRRNSLLCFSITRAVAIFAEK